MAIKIEPDHIPIAKFLAMERILISLVDDNKKLKRYSADHGVQLKDLFIAAANTVSKAEFLAAIAAQKYYTNRSEQNRIRGGGGGEYGGPPHRERQGRIQHNYDRPDTGLSSGGGRPNTGSGRPNTGSGRPNTGGVRPVTGNERPNTGKSASDSTVINENDDKALEENSRRLVRDKVDNRLVEKADSYYALGISNKEDKIGKEVAILEHVMRDLEADADETYQKVEYLENQLFESRSQVDDLSTKLKRVEKNYMDLKRTIAADQQIILNRLDSLQSDHSSQKEYVHSLHSNVEKNFKTVRSSIMRVSSYNENSLREAMANAVKIAMSDDDDATESDTTGFDPAALINGTFGSRKSRRGSSLAKSFSNKVNVADFEESDNEIEVLEVRPVMKEALYPTLNLQKPTETATIEEEDENGNDDDSIRYVNDGNEMNGHKKMTFMDLLKQKGLHLSSKFPEGPMYESVQKDNSNSAEYYGLSPDDKKLLIETNKRLDKFESLLSALTFRIDNSVDLVEKLHSATRLLDSEHNGLLASHKELMRKTDRSEAVTLSILDQIIHACETCQAAVERQEGLSLEQARQFRIISDRLKKTGKGDTSNMGNAGRLTNASYATSNMSILPNIKEWEALEKGLVDETIDNATIMKQLDEYRKVYRSMVLEMNQIINKSKEIVVVPTKNQSPPRQVHVVIPQAKDIENTNKLENNNNEDIKNILQRSDISYNPTIVYLKDEMEHIKTTLSKIQKMQIKPVPKQTIEAEIGSSPSKKSKVTIPRPLSSKSDKQSRGSVDFNLDDDTAEQYLMADVNPSKEYVVDHTIHPVRPSSKQPTRGVQKYFEKYKKTAISNNAPHDQADHNAHEQVARKENKNKYQFIKGDWPDDNNNDNNNNNNDNNDINNNDTTITSSNLSNSVIQNMWQK